MTSDWSSSSCHLVRDGASVVIRASIIGGSGYVGGELARLLLFHPAVELAQVTSERLAGKVEPCDVLFLALPHGEAARKIEQFATLAPRIVDCSADFRLRDPAAYARWYGEQHPAPEWLARFVYGLPELHREAIRVASY